MADQAKLLVAALQYKCSVNYMQLKVSKVNGEIPLHPSPHTHTTPPPTSLRLFYLVLVGFGKLLVG